MIVAFCFVVVLADGSIILVIRSSADIAACNFRLVCAHASDQAACCSVISAPTLIDIGRDCRTCHRQFPGADNGSNKAARGRATCDRTLGIVSSVDGDGVHGNGIAIEGTCKTASILSCLDGKDTGIITVFAFCKC